MFCPLPKLNLSRAASLVALAAAVLLGATTAPAGADVKVKMPSTDFDPVELEIWTDPDFKRRFAESYLSDTELEPKLSDAERLKLIEVFAIINPPPPKEDDKKKDDKKKDDSKPDEKEAVTPAEQMNRLNNALKMLEDYKKEEEAKKLEVSPRIDFFIGNFYMQKGLKLVPGEDATDKEAEAIKKRGREMLLKARDLFKGATQRHPKFRTAWRNLGLLQVRLGEFTAAQFSFAKVITLGGGDSDTYGLLGHCYTQNKRFLPAESAYRMANMLAPDTKNWQMGMVSSFFFQKRYNEVVALTGEMIKEKPDDVSLWMLQANAFIGLKQLKKAAENYEIVHQLGGSTVQSLSLLANIYTNSGLHSAAVKYYNEAMKLAKGTENGKDLVDQILRGTQVFIGQGSIKNAAQLLEDVKTVMGDDLTKKQQNQRGMISARLALFETDKNKTDKAIRDAIKTLLAITTRDPMDGDALILLGDYCYKLKGTIDPKAKSDASLAKTVEQIEQEMKDKKGIDVDNLKGYRAVAQAYFFFERAADIEKFEAKAKVQHALVLVKEKQYKEALALFNSAQQIEYNERIAAYIEQIRQYSTAKKN